MQSVAETLQALADAGHSRTSAHKAMGVSWHVFRAIEVDYPMIRFKGRAPKFDDETLATAMEWRSEGIEWKYIGIGLGVNHESLRHAVEYRCR